MKWAGPHHGRTAQGHRRDDEVIDEMMTAIFARGHCLLVGVPGLAKTLLVSSLALALALSFNPN